MADVESTIKQFIVHEILLEEDESILQLTNPLLETGIVDSLGITNLVMFIEEEFNVSIPLEHLVPENFETIQAISKYLETRLASPTTD